MSTTKKTKVYKKMTKAEMQLAIVRKRECDLKAMVIVEKLLEADIDVQWLLENLKHLNKNHLEDIAEERAITKLCGYVTCRNPLTTIVTQQYRISTRQNKVYDISRRKNFCSSRCYGAFNYLLEQMLTSPLWLRDKEEIPVFQLLPFNSTNHTLGDEVCIYDSSIKQKDTQSHATASETVTNKPVSEITKSMTDMSLNNDVKVNTDLPHATTYTEDSEPALLDNKDVNNVKNVREEKYVGQTKSYKENKIKRNYKDENAFKNNINPQNDKAEKITCNINKSEVSSCSVIENTINRNEEKLETESSKEKFKGKETNHRINAKCSKKSDESIKLNNISPAIHVEHSVKEWISDDTRRLLFGKADEKLNIMEEQDRHDKYLNLCKNLDKLEAQEENEFNKDTTKDILKKPLPHFSLLQEEGKKLELKVRAFYKGSMIMKPPTDEIKNDTDLDMDPVLPLNVQGPKALRRRIFLEKLNKVLPTILQTLTDSKHAHIVARYTCSETCKTVRTLINTFSLSAKNISFKNAEWILVGLIIIKLLSILDSELNDTLTSKQAKMYTSTILSSYKLNNDYLDMLTLEIKKIDKAMDKSNN